MVRREKKDKTEDDFGAGVRWRHREKKLTGWEFWESIGSPKFIAAPMVEASELPWREIMRNYGAQYCYTPMLHSQNFSSDKRYRKREFTTSPTDFPLAVQFCGNNTETVLAAAKLVEGHCDAVDLNLGCPQNIAKKGHYGSFLMEEPHLIRDIVATLARELLITPVTVKIRCFPDVMHTLEYARMLQEAGASALCIHGRTREMKGQQTGVADWNIIKLVKEALTIPVMGNGNVECYADAMACLKETGIDGIMSAEGLLYDPRLFSDPVDPLWNGRRYAISGSARKSAVDLARQYLDICDKYKFDDMCCIKGHIFKLLHHTVEDHLDIRNDLSCNVPHTNCVPYFKSIVDRCWEADQHSFPEPFKFSLKAIEKDVKQKEKPKTDSADEIFESCCLLQGLNDD